MIFSSMPAIFIIVIYLVPLDLCTTFHHLDLDDDYRDRIVDAHNNKRKMVNATNMKKLRYDLNLEQAAKDFSEDCLFSHLNTFGQGENLYRGISSYSQAVIAAIDAWYEEVKYFSYDDMTCVAGEQCGHYLQVIWAETEFVGCSITDCEEFAGAHFIVCRYFPPAYVKNQIPTELPYIRGFTPCLNCSEGYECDDDLCIKPIIDEITTPQATTASPITMKSPGSTTADTDIATTHRLTSTSTSRVTANSTTTEGTKPTSPGMPTTTSNGLTPATTSRVTATSTTTEGTKPTSPGMQTTTSTISCPPTTPTTCSEEYKVLLNEYRKYSDEWKIAFNNYLSDANND